MKKSILFTMIISFASFAHAQFEIDSIGRINIRNPSQKIAQVNIESPWVNLQTKRNGTGNNSFFTTLESFNYMTGNGLLMTIRGVSHGSGGSQNCGVFGMSLLGGANKDFGVIGALYSPDGKGAGIYGTNRWYSDPLSSTTFTKPYAGYFDGDVHIQGNTTYSGTISGSVLLTSAPDDSGNSYVTSLQRERTNEPSATVQLGGLSLQTYFHNVPEPQKPSKSSELWGLDSMEIASMKEFPKCEEQVDVIAQQVLSKQHYGLSVNELEEVFPDLVYENEDGAKSINYIEMVPILVQAIKELSAKVEILEGGKAMKRTKKATNVNAAEGLQVLTLGQNKPNPFSTTTEVEVSVPESVKHAFVYVYDLNGKKVQQVDVTARGKQTVQLNAATLEEGMYLYSLIADGQVVQTRRMIIEK